jgi:hypothetical protein
MSDFLKRRGSLSISGELIHDNPELLAEALNGFLVLRAEHIFITNCMEYSGCHASFDPLSSMQVIPQYNIKITKNVNPETEETTYTFKWVKS